MEANTNNTTEKLYTVEVCGQERQYTIEEMKEALKVNSELFVFWLNEYLKLEKKLTDVCNKIDDIITNI